ncbi:MAG: UPF0489 family protein [Nanoarchaeota archaeon]|nr:UPF0489 family protein [Nanoarchaeota archaeon]MBU1631929.1 UPF0489 family protein [Nanoarchaeota archaeon]MBU1876410.1 UPF0489 family protein [Nanoarchaeota archaeon]
MAVELSKVSLSSSNSSNDSSNSYDYKFQINELQFLGSVPVIYVNNHDEIYDKWERLKLNNSTLLHIDAHPDTEHLTLCEKLSVNGYKSKPITNVGNFLCPAVYHGIVSSIYWLNPHSKERRLQDLGTTRVELRRRKIRAKVAPYLNNNGNNLHYQWSNLTDKEIVDLRNGKGKVIESASDLIIPKENLFILGIDLDAFCCSQGQTIFHNEKGNNGVTDYISRIQLTNDLLRQLPIPDFIFIAESQGYGKMFDCFVPPTKLKYVKESLELKLGELYSS